MSRCRNSVPRVPNIPGIVRGTSSYERDKQRLTLAQRVAIRYMLTHGECDGEGWWAPQDEMQTLNILLQACQVERGELPFVDETDGDSFIPRIDDGRRA